MYVFFSYVFLFFQESRTSRHTGPMCLLVLLSCSAVCVLFILVFVCLMHFLVYVFFLSFFRVPPLAAFLRGSVCVCLM